MQKTQRIGAIVLLVSVAATVYCFWATRPTAAPPAPPSKAKQTASDDRSLVDQSPLKTAQQMAQLATTHERPFAEEALRLAKYDVDIAFENAIRQARLHPPALSAEGKEAEAREQKAESVLQAEQDRAAELTEAANKAPESKKDAIEQQLLQVEASMGLARDEVDDAKHALRAAGGDLVGRLEEQQAQYKARSAATAPAGAETPDQPGLIHRIVQWRELHQKQLQLWQAKGETEEALAALAVKHDALGAQIDQEKATIPELAHHAQKAATAAVAANLALTAQKTQDAGTNLLRKTQELAENQKVLSAFNRRIDTKKQLASEYAQWIETVAAQQRTVLHRGLLGIAIILAIALVVLYFSTWMDSLVKKLSMDRRQVESLRTVARLSLQIFALCMILLVLLGPPGQLGTFLGLAGAGLTVALKDFIVGFLGWFVLMGKNGIRVGDWVEINGVSGEVMQIGPFHTVLTETGNWTDSGHPTGRRVTFTNGYAIEGHYFNFSTTGQWLWDELQVVLPTGQDPYPLMNAIRKRVVEATRESAQQAEQEWRKASNSRELGGISAEPAITVKPVLGGIEMSVRYITRAHERYKLRSQLNQAAVELLGGKAEPVPVAEEATK
jgi:small-conductance mechanosensitive channel